MKKKMHNLMIRRLGIFPLLLILFFLGVSMAWAGSDTSTKEDSAQDSNDSSVMQGFTSQDDKSTGVLSVKDKTKRLVMFLMGVPLLLFLLTTVILGIAMGIYGKQVFVPHMIFAGLSMTLAIAHAIVGIVWFYPF